ncbi:hypothetical protein T4B_6409, partial [Trichinella pseudospiralis]
LLDVDSHLIISSSRAQLTCGQLVYDTLRFNCCENTDLCTQNGTELAVHSYATIPLFRCAARAE